MQAGFKMDEVLCLQNFFISATIEVCFAKRWHSFTLRSPQSKTSAYVCACPAVPRSIPKDSAAYLTGVGGDIVLGWVCGFLQFLSVKSVSNILFHFFIRAVREIRV